MAWRQAVLEQGNYTCANCGHRDPTGKSLDADHIVPLARGGKALDVRNGQVLCKACHKAKTREGNSRR